MGKIYIPSYIIKSNSTLTGMIPIYNEKEVISITNVFKINTSSSDRILTSGEVSFDILNETSPSIITKFVKFSYIASAKAGDDSFEFTINYKDGTSELQQVKTMLIKGESNTELKYIELYCDKNETSTEFYIDTSNGNYSTKGMVSLSNKDFVIDKYNKSINSVNREFDMECPISKVDLNVSSIIETTANLTDNVNYIDSVNITFNKSTEQFKSNEYIKIKLYKFVDLNGSEIEYTVIYNFIFHQLNIGDDYELSEEVYVKPFEGFDKPNFSIGKVDYPEPPSVQSNPSENVIYTAGDMLTNTKPHNVYDSKGNKAIKMGNTVPNGAVNLAYYYNATSSLKDTISVIETNTNTVTLHYVEDWVHRYGLPTDSEEQFLDYIEFEGQVGTYLEGFWGILYRDYIIWEEEPIIDQNPEFVTIYEKFYGLHSMHVPQIKFYKNGLRSGNLELSHTIYTAIDFKRSRVEGVKYEPSRWKCLAKYQGMIKDTKVQYNGSAKYSGVVTKKDGMSNLEPDQEKELIMFPDETGMLHLPNGEKYIDDDLFYITDKFIDGIPLYYKHRLKLKIYDSIGPDTYGVYKTEAIKLVTESGNAINDNYYKYKVEVKPTIYNNVYDAFVYTSFIPSIENPVYVMYNGLPSDSYVSHSSVNPLDIKVGVIEKVSVIPAFDTDQYVVNTKQGITQKSTITMNDPQIIPDDREKINVQFIISSEGIVTPPIEASIINRKYAIYNELEHFKNDDMIISSKNTNGYMTAKDMLFSFATDEEKLRINKDSIFKVYFNTLDSNTLYNKDKVIIYTDPDGKGLIYGRTYVNTGLLSNDGVKNKVLDDSSIYTSDGTNIFKGYGVKCRNINQIVIAAPSETDPMKGWYPKVRYSYFDKVYERTDGSMQLIYSIPEFSSQVFGKYGKPYVDIADEKARLIGRNTAKVINTPMYIKIDGDGNLLNLSAYKVLANGTKRILSIKNHNFDKGFVEFEDKISENDKVYINYTYEEQFYHYKGYYHDFDKETPLVNLNLNPISYNTFIDTSNEMFEKKNTYELFNRTIHFFLRPMRVIDKVTGEVQNDNVFTLYHKFDNQESLGPFDLHIGRIFVRHHASLQSTIILDTRSRGGGLLESITDELRRELEPDSDYYLDIGTLDGKPYQENSVIVVRVDNKILRANGGTFTEEEVKSIVDKWSSYGTYHIVEFVEVIKNKDLPQNSLIVNKNITNQIKYKPSFEITIDKMDLDDPKFTIGISRLGIDKI